MSLIVTRLADRLFGQPLIRNDLRGELVEQIVGMALEPDWELCGSDWAAWDLVRPSDGLRIQVKQSAALQSWSKPDAPHSRPCFSIAAKTGRWDNGDQWIAEPGRNADIFVFGWHPRIDAAADHRDPDQWQFFVVAERDLPNQKSISLAVIKRIVPSTAFSQLRGAVEEVRKALAASNP